jgi:CDP-glucose 4,6-dehydratase
MIKHYLSVCLANMKSIMNSDLRLDVRNEASNEIRHQYLSAAKARNMLGWSPLFDLDSGLQKTIAWYTHLFAPPAE